MLTGKPNKTYISYSLEELNYVNVLNQQHHQRHHQQWHI